MQTKFQLIEIIACLCLINGNAFAQNCKLDQTPVPPDVLVNNKIKEVKVYKTDVSGNKTNYMHFFIDANGVCNKEYFYLDHTKNIDPIISECTFDKKTNCSIFSKRFSTNGTEKEILRDEEYYDDNGKLIKKITLEGEEITQKTIHIFDPNNSANEDKRFYKIYVKENDTLTKVFNIKTAKKHLYYLKNKTGAGYDTERSETIFDTPRSGSVKVYRNEKLINQYEFGKEKKVKDVDDEEYRKPFGLPHPETSFKKVFTNDDKTFAPAKDIENCKFMVIVKKNFNNGAAHMVYDNKTGLLLKEVNTYNDKNGEGKVYEYVK